MPTAPPATRLHCPHCGWYTTETQRSDVIMPTSAMRCPQCQSPDIQRQQASGWLASANQWLGQIRAKARGH